MKTTTSQLIACPMAALLIPAALANPITVNDYDDVNPQISGDLIVWEAQVPNAATPPPAEGDPPPPEGEPTPAADWEIMVKYGDNFRQLTDNDGDDIRAKLSGTSVVWQSWDGNDWEIWAYEASSDTMAQLTDNDTDDIAPCISGTNVVWQAMDAEGDYEIATTSIAFLIPAEISVRITPRALKLGSKGRWVSGSISLGSSGIDPASIDPASILLLDSIPAENVKVNGTGLSMKFDRSALAALIDPAATSAELTLTATAGDGESLSGTDTIKVIP
ncbi:MAG TPA: hypothetical protein VLO11_13785, partial [Luteolibacter sp.]|nr:hypothetical protein [Luteolibacter sp.]